MFFFQLWKMYSGSTKQRNIWREFKEQLLFLLTSNFCIHLWCIKWDAESKKEEFYESLTLKCTCIRSLNSILFCTGIRNRTTNIEAQIKRLYTRFRSNSYAVSEDVHWWVAPHWQICLDVCGCRRHAKPLLPVSSNVFTLCFRRVTPEAAGSL